MSEHLNAMFPRAEGNSLVALPVGSDVLQDLLRDCVSHHELSRVLFHMQHLDGFCNDLLHRSYHSEEEAAGLEIIGQCAELGKDIETHLGHSTKHSRLNEVVGVEFAVSMLREDLRRPRTLSFSAGSRRSKIKA